MPYSEYIPTNPALRPFIECFWFSSPGIDPTSRRITPDGCIDLIYSLSATTNGNATPLLIGTMTRWALSTPAPAMSLIGIRFRPGGIYPFVAVPLHSFTDLIVDADAVVTDFRSPLQNRLLEAQNKAEQIQELERFLNQLIRHFDKRSPVITSIVNYLVSRNGQISIEQLSHQANVSRRQLERLFLRYVGVSPKMLARILRFRHVKSVLKTGLDDSLMGIAFENGYTDHAHLTNEFKAFTGLTPSAYLTQ